MVLLKVKNTSWLDGSTVGRIVGTSVYTGAWLKIVWGQSADDGFVSWNKEGHEMKNREHGACWMMVMELLCWGIWGLSWLSSRFELREERT